MTKDSYLNSDEFFMAIEDHDIKKITTFLESGVNLNLKDGKGRPVLHLAALDIFSDDNEDWQAFDLLLEKGADIEAQDQDCQTVLLDACAGDSPERIKGLLKRGANIEAQDKNSNTALHWVCFFGRPQLTKLLSEKGAEINVHNKNGETALHSAIGTAYSNGLESIDLLLKNGADIEAQDNKGNTALHLARQSGELKIAKFLIKKGASTKIKNNIGEIPITKKTLIWWSIKKYLLLLSAISLILILLLKRILF